MWLGRIERWLILSIPSVDDSRQSSGLRIFVKLASRSNERLKRLLVIYVNSVEGENKKKLHSTCCPLTFQRPVEILRDKKALVNP